MDLKEFRDTLSAAGSFCTVKSEIPVETELLISDYLPQVFKIVKCFIRMVVLQKQLQQGRLSLEGYLRCTVFYQGENGQGLCQAEQKLPFSRVLELPPAEQSAWSAMVSGETEYCNCRAVNQRRVEVRGAFVISASVYPQLQKEAITALSDCGCEQKLTVLEGVKNIAAPDKMITTDCDLSAEIQPGEVLDITGTAQVREVKLISGKAVVKGEISAVLACKNAQTGVLEKQKAAMQFNHILDVEGLSEDCRCIAVVEPVGFSLSAAGESEGSAQYRLTATALLHLRAYRDFSINVVQDAFSTQYELKTEQGEIAVETVGRLMDETITLQAVGRLPEENAEVLACFANFGTVELAEDKPALRVRGMATVFCKNSLDEIECCEKPVEIDCPLPFAESGQMLHAECWVSVENAACSRMGGEWEAAVTARLEGIVLCRKNTMCVIGAEVGEPLSPQDPDIALRVYYAHEGEEIFAIARYFHVSPGDMLRANGLTEPVLSGDQRLLIPGAG